MRRSVVAVVVACWTFAACSGGKSDDPTPANTNGDYPCLTDLASYCCADAAPHDCLATFDAAAQCAAWPSGAEVKVYATPCHGYKAVRLVSAWSTFYVYDAATSALVSISDNSAFVKDPRSTTIACGAGPTGFTVPADCSAAWLDAQGSTGCSAAGGAMKAYCAP